MSRATPTPAVSSATAAPDQRDWSTATVRYRKRSVIRLFGPATRHLYEFSSARNVQAVYRVDLPYLLGTGLFETV